MKNESAARPKRDAFAEAKDTFIMSVVRDRKVGGSSVKVAVAMAIRFANRKHFEATGELAAWPSERTLNTETGMFRSQIGRAVKALEENGHLVVHRPEKRGAKHHNRYVLRIDNGRTDAAIADADNGRTHKAFPQVDNGRTDAAIPGGQLAAPMRPLMAAPVGPNSLEETLDGAGALSRPAPEPADLDAIMEEARVHTALDAPMSAANSNDPDAWRSLPEFRGRADDNQGAPESALVSAPDYEEEEREAERRFALATSGAVRTLQALHPATDIDLRAHVQDLVSGLMEGVPAQAERFHQNTKRLIDHLPRADRDDALLAHADIVESLASLSGGAHHASRTAEKFMHAHARAVDLEASHAS